MRLVMQKIQEPEEKNMHTMEKKSIPRQRHSIHF